MVPLIGRFTRTGEGLLEHDAALDFRGVEPPPAPGVGTLSGPLLALIRQQFVVALAHAVVVRLGDSHGAVVRESQQPLVRDGESDLGIEGDLRSGWKRNDLVHRALRACSSARSAEERSLV